jgi:tRNA nucleotidyltransferase (CCA-adding enzyme)
MMHDKSFIDDPTRILRAIRFEQRLGFRIEGRTLRQIREAVRKNMFAHLKPSRISRELKLIIGEDNAQACLRRVNQLCGFKIDAKGEILRSRDHRDP